MASAWGLAWGGSWGKAWGWVQQEGQAVSGGGGYFTPEAIRKSRQAKDEMEIVLILSALARVGYLQ